MLKATLTIYPTNTHVHTSASLFLSCVCICISCSLFHYIECVLERERERKRFPLFFFFVFSPSSSFSGVTKICFRRSIRLSILQTPLHPLFPSLFLICIRIQQLNMYIVKTKVFFVIHPIQVFVLLYKVKNSYTHTFYTMYQIILKHAMSSFYVLYVVEIYYRAKVLYQARRGFVCK